MSEKEKNNATIEEVPSFRALKNLHKTMKEIEDKDKGVEAEESVELGLLRPAPLPGYTQRVLDVMKDMKDKEELTR